MGLHGFVNVCEYLRTAIGQSITVTVLTNERSESFTQKTFFTSAEHCRNFNAIIDTSPKFQVRAYTQALNQSWNSWSYFILKQS